MSGKAVALWVLAIIASVVGAAAPSAVDGSAAQTVAAARATELSPDADVFAAGDFRLLARVPRGFSQSPDSGTLVNEKTGARVHVAAPRGCVFEIMGPTVLIDECSTPGQPPLEVYRLHSGRTSPLSVPGVPSAVGTEWLELQQTGELAHSVTNAVFVNLDSGQVVANSQQIGGRRYVDLDRSSLRRTACRPLTVPASFDGAAQTDVPGSLVFIGSLGVKSNVSRSGRVAFQRCGSRAMIHRGVGAGFVVNSKVIVWGNKFGDLAGIIGSSGNDFSLTLPSRLRRAALVTININSYAIYLQLAVSAGEPSVWRVALPKGL